MKLNVEDWGRLDYDAAHARQRERLERVQAHPEEAYLCLVEHPPVYTLGRFGNPANLISPDPSVPLRRIERGGDITYHGPGQLVGYVILHLDRRRLTVKGLISRIERILARAVARFGVRAESREGARGLWVGGRKLVSIGLGLRRSVTWHGFALNVSTDLSRFDRIHPCGMPGCPMTNLSIEAGRLIPMEEAASAVAAAFRDYFDRLRSAAAEIRSDR